ncbi:hypothetical protein GE09DRAFT_1060504 [Coniochaeta sp. 2T2.1]|nr:hypothetical protein GE09DRAFT_1060504 [Coniochaeta sp. 2T2.1]
MFCGGLLGPVNNGTLNSTLFTRFARRAVASANILVTVYANPDAGANPKPAPAPGMDGGGVTITATATATIPAMTTITTTIAYTTVCPTNPASIVIVEYCTTFTVPDCGCPT